MIVKIQVRDANGHFVYRDSNVGEFAEVGLRTILEDGRDGRGGDGWWWLRQWLCKLCIQQIDKHHGNPTEADKWYRRYQLIRGIE